MDHLPQGNRAFVDEDYDAALNLYTKVQIRDCTSALDLNRVSDTDKLAAGALQALAAQPDSAEIYVARSAAHIRLDQFLEAAEDASQALLLQPSYPKALVRRGWDP